MELNAQVIAVKDGVEVRTTYKHYIYALAPDGWTLKKPDKPKAEKKK